MTNLKTFWAAAALVLFAPAAHAISAIEVDLDGTYSVVTTPGSTTGTVITTLEASGTLDIAIFNVPATSGPSLYTVSGSANAGTLAGTFNDSFVGPAYDPLDIFLTIGAIFDDLADTSPVPVSEAGLGTGTFDIGGSASTFGPTGALFETKFSFDFVTEEGPFIGPLIDAEIDALLFDLGLPGLTGPLFPANDSGAFGLSATVDVAAVPLPAGGLLMLTAIGGVVVARRAQRRG